MCFAFAACYLLEMTDLENLLNEWMSLTKHISLVYWEFLSIKVEQCNDTIDTWSQQVSLSNTAALRNLFTMLRRSEKKIFFWDRTIPSSELQTPGTQTMGTEALFTNYFHLQIILLLSPNLYHIYYSNTGKGRQVQTLTTLSKY